MFLRTVHVKFFAEQLLYNYGVSGVGHDKMLLELYKTCICKTSEITYKVLTILLLANEKLQIIKIVQLFCRNARKRYVSLMFFQSGTLCALLYFV